MRGSRPSRSRHKQRANNVLFLSRADANRSPDIVRRGLSLAPRYSDYDFGPAGLARRRGPELQEHPVYPERPEAGPGPCGSVFPSWFLATACEGDNKAGCDYPKNPNAMRPAIDDW